MADLVTGFAVLFGQFYPREHRDEFSCAIQIGKYLSYAQSAYGTYICRNFELWDSAGMNEL